MALSRKFVDSEGVNWQVYELSNDATAAELDVQRWLYFFSRSATRCLTAYPDDWALMDWQGLERLCRRSAPPRPELSRRRAVPAAVKA